MKPKPMPSSARAVLRDFFVAAEDDDYLLMPDAMAKCCRSYSGTRAALEYLEEKGIAQRFQVYAPRDFRVLGFRRGPALRQGAQA